jgi:hypothetical protein
MPLNLKVSFDLSDFEDNEFLQDLGNIYKFNDNVIELEHKLFRKPNKTICNT